MPAGQIGTCIGVYLVMATRKKNPTISSGEPMEMKQPQRNRRNRRKSTPGTGKGHHLTAGVPGDACPHLHHNQTRFAPSISEGSPAPAVTPLSSCALSCRCSFNTTVCSPASYLCFLPSCVLQACVVCNTEL